MSRSTRWILAASLLFLVSSLSVAQKSRNKLEKERDRLDNKIKYTNQLLRETKKDQKLTETELVILNKKINYRQELISNISFSIRRIEKQVQENYQIIQSMEHDLEELKQEYAKMIYHAYKNRSSFDRMMFLFSSATFDQAYKRMKYLQQYSDYRKRQAELINQTKLLLDQKVVSLQEQKIEKELLLSSRIKEKKALDVDKVEQSKGLANLKSKEADLLKKHRRYKREREKLNKAIEAMIAKELAARKGTSSFALTPAQKELAQAFELNKGKLPWPVERGQAYRQYGKHPHPVLPNVVEENKGIDIITNKGADVLSVFKGEVSAVILIPGAGKAVMISHGNYRSVYTNLQEVYVKKGDKVSVRQKLGKLLTDASTSRTEAHLEIWKISATNSGTVDPAQWLDKQ